MTYTVNRLTDALKGRYDIQRELGAGGMATVYLARDIRHTTKSRSRSTPFLTTEATEATEKDENLDSFKIAASIRAGFSFFVKDE